MSSSLTKHDNKGDNETLSATVEMCKYCFDIIITELLKSSSSGSFSKKSKPSTNLETTIEFIPPSFKCPLFVSWDKLNKDQSSEYHLRGCIGTLAPRKLHTSLSEYAKTSAFQDPRFHSITLKEVSKLRVSVSLLVNYEECDDCLDWLVGIHGIIINFHYQSRSYSATFLPEVAKEQRWTQRETIEALVQKSGFHHKLTPEIQKSIRCTRYQSSKQYLTYENYETMADAISIEQK